MTVIAWDNKLLVADGRSTRGGSTLVSDDLVKLKELTIPELGKCVVGLCGALDTQGPFIEHLKENGLEPFDSPLVNDGEHVFSMRGLVVTRKGKCLEVTTEGGWHEVTSPVAIGSGCEIAQHYLTTGHDAVKAVVEACKTELSCGGKITVYDFKSHSFGEAK